jgi:hypothetical protein
VRQLIEHIEGIMQQAHSCAGRDDASGGHLCGGASAREITSAGLANLRE